MKVPKLLLRVTAVESPVPRATYLAFQQLLHTVLGVVRPSPFPSHDAAPARRPGTALHPNLTHGIHPSQSPAFTKTLPYLTRSLTTISFRLNQTLSSNPRANRMATTPYEKKPRKKKKKNLTTPHPPMLQLLTCKRSIPVSKTRLSATRLLLLGLPVCLSVYARRLSHSLLRETTQVHWGTHSRPSGSMTVPAVSHVAEF